jgi:hypothetical protein
MSKNLLNEELNSMKYLFGYKRGVVISEQSDVYETEEFTPQVTDELDITQIQKVADQEGADINVTDIVDTDNPMCTPMTGDQQKDGIIARIWDWANDPANRGSLKQTLSTLKDAIFKAKEQEPEGGEVEEQVGTAALITIGGVALTPSLLIAIGGILLFIIIIAMISKGGKRRSSPCRRRAKLVRRFGMDGNFM